MAIAPDLTDHALDGRYELRELIGEGTFGRVYRGFDRRLRRPVAVKVIKPWWAQDPRWVAAFERETQMLAALSAPGIVEIHDVGHAPEGLYCVSELVEGEDLAARLRRGPLTVAEARSIALGLCRGLAAAHGRRIVHRDIKPANVLLRARPGEDGAHVVLGDFGVARLAEGSPGETAPSLLVGTPRYMAPEQAGDGPLTPATDVYSVGVVLYEMLAGHPPFAADSPIALALAHRDDPPPPLPAQVPRPLARIVEQALLKDPAARPPDAGAMAQALRAVPETDRDATRAAPGRGPRVQVDPPARRRAGALLAGATALVAVLAGLAGLLGSSGGHPARATAGPPVEVPLVVGETGADAVARLRTLGLLAVTIPVPAPGIRPGTVTSQTPIAGETARARARVSLAVAEVPFWHRVAGFSTIGSPTVTIRGRRWRIVVDAVAARHCTLLVFCAGSSVTVRRVGSATVLARTGLADGIGQAHGFSTGPGTYRLQVHPASGATRWQIAVQDLY